MNLPALPPDAHPPVWTCPYCPLLCDDLMPSADTGQPGLAACDRAHQRLGQAWLASAATPRVRGQAASLDAALDAAAELLRASRQPLMAGLGADVAGARALYPVAATTGAIVDAEGGGALAQALRAQQDRGGYTTTLAEVATRADVIVMVGSWAPERAPRLLARVLGTRTADSGAAPPALVALAAPGAPRAAQGVPVQAVAGSADLPDTVATLTALVAQRPVPAPDELRALAEQLRAARYAVLVWEPAQLGPHAALLIERLQGLIGLLNQTTRAAGLPMGGGEGAATCQQVFAWLSGLPLRSRVTPRGIEHEPLRFDAPSLLERGAVDALLWVSAFGGAAPPATTLPRIVLAPALALGALGDESNTIVLPVAVPGVDTAGHLFRTDGVVLMPLHALRDTAVPTVAEVAHGLLMRLSLGAAGPGVHP